MHSISRHQDSQPEITHRSSTQTMPLLIVISILALLLVACGGTDTSNTASSTPAPARVNGFGTAANHPHSLLALPGNVLVMATHYGLFRSSDGGAHWLEVAGGPGQPMEDLMTYSLVSSSLDQQRMYVLTQIVSSTHRGTLGLYTSSDEGNTWKLAISYASLNASSVFLAQTGNDTPDEVYIYLNDLGPQGLKVSRDAGQHFTNTGPLPFGSLAALLAIPGAPGELLAASSEGLARSIDSGQHWTLIKGIEGGIFTLTTSGPRGPIYASGDAGVYASHDGGKSFTLVYTQSSLGSLTVSSTQPQILYGKTGTTIYRSTDGGHTWTPLPHVQGNLFSLEADPTDPSHVYLSLSYPTEVYRYDQAGGKWTSLTPAA